jgi:hypothetical protein
MKTQKKERDPRVTVKAVKPTLTKAQMIQTIQRFEAAAFLELKESERDYGSESNLTRQCRTRWAGINSILTELGIQQDFTLPDNQAATAIICERIAKQRTGFTISADE